MENINEMIFTFSIFILLIIDFASIIIFLIMSARDNQKTQKEIAGIKNDILDLKNIILYTRKEQSDLDTELYMQKLQSISPKPKTN